MKTDAYRKYHFLLAILIVVIAVNPLIGSEDSMSFFKYVEKMYHTVMVLKTDLDQLMDKKNKEEISAELFISDTDGETDKWKLKVEARGAFRRRACSFPPIRLDLRKKDLEEKGFLPFDKVKIVTHCLEGAVGEENVYKELLAYEIYNMITPQSFKAKKVKIRYEDRKDQEKYFESTALVVEPNDELAHRLGGEDLDKMNLAPDSLVSENYNTFALYQFMIANHDWSLMFRKNTRTLFLPEQNKYLLVGYDFDFSGLVSPSYYRMDPDINIKHPRDRLYMGEHFTSELKNCYDKFLLVEDDVIKKIKNSKELSVSERGELMQFFKSFYKVLKSNKEEISTDYLLPTK